MKSKWLSRNERSYWCCEFSRCGREREALAAEIRDAQTVIDRQPQDSLLVAVEAFDARLTPELRAFFERSARRGGNPIRKMAIIGITGWRRFAYTTLRRVTWPARARFFSDWELAKDWLVGERF